VALGQIFIETLGVVSGRRHAGLRRA